MNKKKSYASGVNIGSSSILVTFVLLCLVTFAALSFVSANADNRLAKQTAERTTGYYEANNTAEFTLKEIDEILKDHFRNTQTKKEYFDGICDELFVVTYGDEAANEEEGLTENVICATVEKSGNDDVYLHYSCSVSDNQILDVTLKAIYPESANDEMFEIVQWETVTEYVEDVPGSEESGFLF